MSEYERMLNILSLIFNDIIENGWEIEWIFENLVVRFPDGKRVTIEPPIGGFPFATLTFDNGQGCYNEDVSDKDNLIQVMKVFSHEPYQFEED